MSRFDDLFDYGDEATDILEDPRGYILGVIAGAVAGAAVTLMTEIADFYLTVQQTVVDELTDIGSMIMTQSGNVGDLIITGIELPIELTGNLAASAGPFAPVLSALLFAVIAVVTAAIVILLYRIVRFI